MARTYTLLAAPRLKGPTKDCSTQLCISDQSKLSTLVPSLFYLDYNGTYSCWIVIHLPIHPLHLSIHLCVGGFDASVMVSLASHWLSTVLQLHGTLTRDRWV